VIEISLQPLPSTETATLIWYWMNANEDIEIEDALSTSSLVGGNDEKAIHDWIADEDAEHFISVYCPNVASPHLFSSSEWKAG
jgi:hypothetical protein